MNVKRGAIGVVLCTFSAFLSGSCSSSQSSNCLPTLAYTHSIGQDRQDIEIISGCGKQHRTLMPPQGNSFSSPAVSADGKSVVFISTLADEGAIIDGVPEPPYEVFRGQVSSGAVLRVTQFFGEAENPVLSPDNKTLTFAWNYISDPGAAPGVMKEGIEHLSLAGAHLPVNDVYAMVEFSNLEGDSAWSPDGKLVATLYTRMDASHIAIFDSATWKQKTAFDLDHEAAQVSFSPDGKYLLMIVKPSPKPPQVYARNLSTGANKQITTFANGVAAASIANDWSLFYIDDLPGSGNSGSLHQYNFQTHSDTIIIKTGVYGDVSVARTGSVGKRPGAFNF
ncbi:hypothetical protein [Streptacidiphilus cavernicola]|uniref:Lipoprotein LpqB beta-propeller domain-containing protein n=1 Tax=Streptacidiphilus cavernicola TaxID=3342716 RepID=A0ABV6W743_9ACTN